MSAGFPAAFLAAGLFLGHAWAATPPSKFQEASALFNLKCAKCHTIGGGRRVGPDLRGVTDRHPADWMVAFIMNPDAYLESDPVAKALLKENNGVRMENAHVTRAQAEGIIEYLKGVSSAPQEVAGPAPLEEDPLYKKLLMPDEGYSISYPGLAWMLLFVALAMAAWQIGLRSASSAAAVLACVAAYWAFGGRHYYHLIGNQQGYEPDHPIAFSHKLHAGNLRISCFYCHHGAEKSDVAGIASVNICMNCHRVVRKTAAETEPSAEIAKLVGVWDSRGGEHSHSIEWTRVHHLPDYVHFSHRVHVANNIQCQECHGPVQEMALMRQAASLSMGWCIDCHRRREGEAPTHWKRAGGPLDCSACHW